MPYLTSDLIASVRRRSFAPTGQSTFTTADILAMADEEIQARLIPHLVSFREEYLVTFTDQTIVSGTNAYAIPSRAIGMALREVKIVDSSGGYSDIPQLATEALASDGSGNPSAFYLRENSIVLWPRPNVSGLTLRTWYLRRHNLLIETSSAALVSGVSGNTVTVGSVPAGWSTSDTFDVIKGSGGYEILSMDQAVTAVTSSTLDFTVAPGSNVGAGAYIAKAGYTPVISLPPEYQPILAQAVTVRMLRSMRMAGADDEERILEKMLDSVVTLVSPRVIGEQTKIMSVWS